MFVKYFLNVKFLFYLLFLKWYDLIIAYLKCDICDKFKMYLMSGFKKIFLLCYVIFVKFYW